MELWLTAVTSPTWVSMLRKPVPLGTVNCPWMAPPGPPGPPPWPRNAPGPPGPGAPAGAVACPVGGAGAACDGVVVVVGSVSATATPIQPARTTAIVAAPRMAKPRTDRCRRGARSGDAWAGWFHGGTDDAAAAAGGRSQGGLACWSG